MTTQELFDEAFKRILACCKVRKVDYVNLSGKTRGLLFDVFVEAVRMVEEKHNGMREEEQTG